MLSVNTLQMQNFRFFIQGVREAKLILLKFICIQKSSYIHARCLSIIH